MQDIPIINQETAFNLINWEQIQDLPFEFCVPQSWPSVSDLVACSSVSFDNYTDISDLFCMSQREAAKKLGIPSSTLSKRWREATINRKWPSQELKHLEKEIQLLQIQEDTEQHIAELQKRMKELSRPTFVRIQNGNKVPSK